MIGSMLFALLVVQPVEEGPPGALSDASRALSQCLVREGEVLAGAPGSHTEKLNLYFGACAGERANAARVYAAERPQLASRAGAWANERYLIFARRTFLPRVESD